MKKLRTKNRQSLLRIWETICTFAHDIQNKKMEQTVFELELLEDARDFFDNKKQ